MNINTNQIKEGDVFSEESHYKVVRVYGDSVDFIHLEGNAHVTEHLNLKK